MDWITQVGISATGLPWWAVGALLLLFGIAREIVPACLKWRSASLEERKYGDTEAREAREALVEELRRQVVELAADVKLLTRQHAESAAAHTKCQIEQEQLRGELNVMKEKLIRLESHDKNAADHVKGLQQAVAKIDSDAAADLLK